MTVERMFPVNETRRSVTCDWNKRPAANMSDDMQMDQNTNKSKVSDWAASTAANVAKVSFWLAPS